MDLFIAGAMITGHSRAMYNVGAFNASGLGIPKNIAEAIKWYERAADVGNPAANGRACDDLCNR